MKWLTKSDYMKFLIHPAYLWLQKNDKDKLPPFDAAGQAAVDQGNLLENYAQKLYPKGVEIKAKDMFDGIDQTERVLRASVEGGLFFQPAVLTARKLYARADVLKQNDDGSWDIHEIKSATKPKADYAHDLAFQKITFEEAGYDIRRTYLVHINSSYVRDGDIDAKQLFRSVNLTSRVDAILPQTRKNIQIAKKLISSVECPDDDPIHSGNYYAWRDIYRHIYPELPQDCIYNLTRLSVPQLNQLREKGITRLADIPSNIELKPQQIAQLASIKAGAPTFKATKIATSLNKLTFPLYFFDYETVFPGLPAYDGTRPYQQVPFQYSLHILRAPGKKLEHREFLATGADNPMPKLLKQLLEDLGPSGSVIVWNKSFEMSVNRAMAEHYPECKEFLYGLNKRVYDLMEIFSNNLYADQRFLGSASIKKVLPALVPELSYEDLEIGEGGTASLLWQQTALGQITGADADKIHKNLKIYCGQDTLAMVKIYEFLLDVAKKAPSQLSWL